MEDGMITLRFKTILALAVICPLSLSATELPACVDSAAIEFGVPVKVFQALALQGIEKPVPRFEQHFGVMGMHKMAIKVAAEGIGAITEDVKADSCTSYRAAAWWLAVPAGGNDSDDIWLSVNRYFYGERKRPTYPMTERVREIYNQLN